MRPKSPSACLAPCSCAGRSGSNTPKLRGSQVFSRTTGDPHRAKLLPSASSPLPALRHHMSCVQICLAPCRPLKGSPSLGHVGQYACIWRNPYGYHRSQQAACTPVLDKPPRITSASQGGSIQDSPAPLCSLKAPHAVHTSCWEGQREELQPGLSILLTCFWGTLLGRRRVSPSG